MDRLGQRRMFPRAREGGEIWCYFSFRFLIGGREPRFREKE
jgi:hypothetical protein